MRILFIIDDLKKLKPRYDSTLYLLKEFCRRGNETWAADVPDIYADKKSIYALARTLKPKKFLPGNDHVKHGHHYLEGARMPLDLKKAFDLILIRKEPPFDMNYVHLTYLLDQVAPHVFISNNPTGIRNTNEKLAILGFPDWTPETLITSQIDLLLKFYKEHGFQMVVKPLDMKGGTDVLRLQGKRKNWVPLLKKLTHKESRMITAQEFVTGPGRARDKRITLLDGKVFWDFEKRAAAGEFRTNLDRGGLPSRVPLTFQEKKLLGEIRPYILTQGLHLVGLDIIHGKLIDFNVTCPGGMAEAIPLYREEKLVSVWADFLEKKVSTFPPHRAL